MIVAIFIANDNLAVKTDNKAFKMNSFVLYKSNGQSLKRLGFINKSIFYTISSVFVVFIPVMPIIKGRIHFILLAFCFILIVLSIISLVVYSRYLKKHLEVIGDLKVNLTSMIKTIGDYEETYDYSKIKGIEVSQHMRKIFLPSNFDRSLTYLVTLKYDDRDQEQFVIASQSSEVPDINFIKTIRSIEKCLKLKLLKSK